MITGSHPYLVPPMTNIGNVQKLHPDETRKSEKRKYVECLVFYPTPPSSPLQDFGCIEFEDRLYTLPLEKLIALHEKLQPIFTNFFM